MIVKSSHNIREPSFEAPLRKSSPRQVRGEQLAGVHLGHPAVVRVVVPVDVNPPPHVAVGGQHQERVEDLPDLTCKPCLPMSGSQVSQNMKSESGSHQTPLAGLCLISIQPYTPKPSAVKLARITRVLYSGEASSRV